MHKAAPATAPQPITHRRVLNIALPIVLSNATVPILGLVDIGVVGQTGDAAPQAAVTLGAIVISTAFWLFSFLRLGTVGLVGQALGAEDQVEATTVLTRALFIAGAGGLMLIVLQPGIFALALWSSQASAEVEALAYTYMAIRIWGAPFVIANYALEAWLIALERTRSVFTIQLVKNGTNIALSFLFVLGFEWGVAGVAIATIIAEVLGTTLAFYLCRGAFDGDAWRDWTRVFDRARLVTLAILNVDIMIRSGLLMAIFASVAIVGSRFGDATLAANGVLEQFLMVTAYAMDGFAVGAETLIARAMGRRDPARLRRSAVITSTWGAITCVSMAVIFAVFGPTLIDIMTKAPEVQAAARTYLPWMILAPLVGCAAWMLDGIFIGATRARDMRNMMILSAVIYVIALLIFVPIFANHGLWLALLISFAARGITLGLRYPALERAAAQDA